MTTSALASGMVVSDPAAYANSAQPQSSLKSSKHSVLRWKYIFLGLAGLDCLFQIAWFWRYTSHNINYDAISYIGIARHILDGNVRASLHGYWSPLISWCIAAASFFSNNLLLMSRLTTIASFILCLPLTYLLSLRLWRSPAIAGFSVLCFTLARGVVAFSVYFIGADFLFTAAVLGYFIVLLCCIRKPTPAKWLGLGAVHSLAFMAKAFGMPWLAVSTLLAAILFHKGRLRRAAASVFMGLAIPILIWCTWGMVLQMKYRRFTAGYQSKWNLLSVDVRNTSDRGDLLVLTDTSRSNDNYMVVDSMYPSSPLWDARIGWAAIPPILLREEGNLPEAIKQVIILITPGGVLALLLALRRMHRGAMQQEAVWAWVVIGSTVSLVLGYSMLVVDARYVLPVVPLLLVLAARFFLPAEKTSRYRVAEFAPGVLFIGSLIFFALYPASPFRSLRRDYQRGIYAIAAAIEEIPRCDRMVSIGSGPFPEHGVGWEAGIYAGYFAQCRIVGFSAEVPSPAKAESAIADIQKLRANSVLIVGGPGNRNYAAILRVLQTTPDFSSQKILQLAPDSQAILFWKNED